MTAWRECKLGDFADIQTGPFGSQLHAADYVDVGIPSIMPTNIGNRLEVKTDSIACIKEADAKRLSRYLIKENDIVYSRRGDVEKCAFITSKQSGWLCGTGCLRVRFVSTDLFPKFCAYYLSTEEIKGWVSGNAVGTTMPNLNSSILKRVPLILPPLPEQKAIAAVLSSLDDKIDLLHRQNKTLEAIAETLFRHWFVEEAQEDWEVTTIGNVLDTVLGGTPSTNKPEFWNGTIPWINSGEVNKFRIVEASKYITELGLNKSNTKLLPKGTTVVAITGATMGQVSLLEIDTCANQSVVGVIPNKRLPKEFVFLWIMSKIREIILSETGGAQPHINKNDINEAEIVIPTSDFLVERIRPFEAWFSKISANIFQIQTLEKLRDTLLPKLMSGEVRVRT